MTTGGEAHHHDALRVDPVGAGPQPDETDGALRILQRRRRPGLPALMRQAVAQHIDRAAGGREMARTLEAFLVDNDPAITATGDDEDGRSIRRG